MAAGSRTAARDRAVALYLRGVSVDGKSLRGVDDSRTAPGHVGMVIGNGNMVAAPHKDTVVQIQPYTTRSDIVGFARPRS